MDRPKFLCLRLPFGTTPTPDEYETISKVAIDLGNELLREESQDTTYLNSPHRNLLLEENKHHSEDNFAKTYPLEVYITAKEASMDGFINDITTITVDDKHWVERAKIAALLVINTLFQPLKASEPLKHDDPLSLRKLAGGGELDERKTCLGWDTNTHSLRVFIPK